MTPTKPGWVMRSGHSGRGAILVVTAQHARLAAIADHLVHTGSHVLVCIPGHAPDALRLVRFGLVALLPDVSSADRERLRAQFCAQNGSLADVFDIDDEMELTDLVGRHLS